MLLVVTQTFFVQGADQPKLNLGYNPGSGTRSYASGGGGQQPAFPGAVLSEKEQLAADLAAIAKMEAREAARLAELERKAAESRRQAAQKRAEYEAAAREEERRREFRPRFEKLVAQLPGVERALILEIFTNAFEVEARLGQSAEVAVLDILGRQVPAPEPAPSPRVTTAASTVPQTGAPGVHVVRLDGGPSDAPVDKIKPAPRRQGYHSTQRHEGYVPSFAAASAPVRGAAAAVVAPQMPPSYQEAVAAPMYPQISRSVPQARSAWDAPGEYQPGGAAAARTSAPTARMTRKEQEIKALQDFIALQEADLKRFDEWIPTSPIMQELYGISQQLSQHQPYLLKYQFMQAKPLIAQNYKEFIQLLPFYNAYNALLAQQAALNPQVEALKKQRSDRELELTKKRKELSLKTTEAAQAARPVPAGMAAAAVGRAAAKKEASDDRPAYQPGGAAADPAPKRRVLTIGAVVDDAPEFKVQSRNLSAKGFSVRGRIFVPEELDEDVFDRDEAIDLKHSREKVPRNEAPYVTIAKELEAITGFKQTPITNHMIEEVKLLINSVDDPDQVIEKFRETWQRGLKDSVFERYKSFDFTVSNHVHYGQLILYMADRMGIGKEEIENFVNLRQTEEQKQKTFKKLKKRIDMFKKTNNDLFGKRDEPVTEDEKKRFVLDVIFKAALNRSDETSSLVQKYFDDFKLWDIFNRLTNLVIDKNVEEFLKLGINPSMDKIKKLKAFLRSTDDSKEQTPAKLFRIIWVNNFAALKTK